MARGAVGCEVSCGQVGVSGAVRVARSSLVRRATIEATVFLESQGAEDWSSESAHGGEPAAAAPSGKWRELKREQQLQRATEGAGRRAEKSSARPSQMGVIQSTSSGGGRLSSAPW